MWLECMAHKSGVHIQHAFNHNGEFRGRTTGLMDIAKHQHHLRIPRMSVAWLPFVLRRRVPTSTQDEGDVRLAPEQDRVQAAKTKATWLPCDQCPGAHIPPRDEGQGQTPDICRHFRRAAETEQV